MAPAFDTFAQSFVRNYWETLKLGTYPMPPNEPVEESLEELLTAVTFEISPASKVQNGRLLTMRSKRGDWWTFTFRDSPHGWEVIGCLANSDDSSHPHDLFDTNFGQHFGPFLRHVTAKANPPRTPNHTAEPGSPSLAGSP